MVFRTCSIGTSAIHHTPSVWTDFTVQPSPVLWYKVSPHICQQKLGFSFSDVQKGLEV